MEVWYPRVHRFGWRAPHHISTAQPVIRNDLALSKVTLNMSDVIRIRGIKVHLLELIRLRHQERFQ